MENLGIPSDNLELLQRFVQLCKLEPDVLHAKELSFFKDWLVNE